jgi:hypothetical protein
LDWWIKLSKVRQRFSRWFKHAEKRVLVGYIRYARAHRESNKLPLILFLLLFFDAFVMVIPSMLLTAAAVTITPRKWKLFAGLFVIAVVANNAVTYVMGKWLPNSFILKVVENMGITPLWESALNAILDYGKYATLVGGFFPLPTQLVTMIIGMAESQSLQLGVERAPHIGVALAFAAVGHGIKIYVFAALVRYGWVKFEQRVAQKNQDL